MTKGAVKNSFKKIGGHTKVWPLIFCAKKAGPMEGPAKWCYNLTAMKNQYSTPIQLKMPVDMERIIEISDPVYMCNEVMDHMDLNQYIAEEKDCNTGCPKYDQIKLLKVILFAFMENGYCSVRMIRKLCTTDIRFLWLLDETPAQAT